MISAPSAAQVDRTLWRFQRDGNAYRIISRQAGLNGWTAALTGASTTGAAASLVMRGPNTPRQRWYVRNVASFLHHQSNRPYPWRAISPTFSVFLRPNLGGWETAVRDGILAWNRRDGGRDMGGSIATRTGSADASLPHQFEARNE